MSRMLDDGSDTDYPSTGVRFRGNKRSFASSNDSASKLVTHNVLDFDDFDSNWVRRIQNHPYRRLRSTLSTLLGFAFCVFLVPFGPLTMLISGVVGATVGYGIGFVVDRYRKGALYSTAEVEVRRVVCLMRYAIDVIQEVPLEEAFLLLEKVVVEMRPLIEIARQSPQLAKRFRVLYAFLKREEIIGVLYTYIDTFLSTWQGLGHTRFSFVAREVLGPLIDLEEVLGVSPKEGIKVLRNVAVFLSDPRIRRLLPAEGKRVITRAMEAVAIASDPMTRRLKLEDAGSPPGSPGGAGDRLTSMRVSTGGNRDGTAMTTPRAFRSPTSGKSPVMNRFDQDRYVGQEKYAGQDRLPGMDLEQGVERSRDGMPLPGTLPQLNRPQSSDRPTNEDFYDAIEDVIALLPTQRGASTPGAAGAAGGGYPPSGAPSSQSPSRDMSIRPGMPLAPAMPGARPRGTSAASSSVSGDVVSAGTGGLSDQGSPGRPNIRSGVAPVTGVTDTGMTGIALNAQGLNAQGLIHSGAVPYAQGLFQSDFEAELAVLAESASSPVPAVSSVPGSSGSAVNMQQPGGMFFHSFADFLLFDAGIKHRVPVSIGEFRFLLEKEVEPLTATGWEVITQRDYSMPSANENPWSGVPKAKALDTELDPTGLVRSESSVSSDKKKKKAAMIVLRLYSELSPTVLLRAYSVLRGVSLEVAFYLVHCCDMRKTWDANFSEIYSLDCTEHLPVFGRKGDEGGVMALAAAAAERGSSASHSYSETARQGDRASRDKSISSEKRQISGDRQGSGDRQVSGDRSVSRVSSSALARTASKQESNAPIPMKRPLSASMGERSPNKQGAPGSADWLRSGILYCVLRSPMGVTPRDFLQYRRCVSLGKVPAAAAGAGASTDTLKASSSSQRKTVVIFMRSAEHEKKPENPKYIRAESIISGYVFRQDPKSNDTQLFICSQTDVKGLIPRWVVNLVAARAPSQWIDSLQNACNEFVKDLTPEKVKTVNEYYSMHVAALPYPSYPSSQEQIRYDANMKPMSTAGLAQGMQTQAGSGDVIGRREVSQQARADARGSERSTTGLLR